MSTSTEITRLTNARNTIRDKLIDLGLAASTDKLDTLATAVDGIVNRGAISASVQEGDTYTIPAGYHNGSGTVAGVAGGGNYSLQAKTITPTKSQQSVTADTGYYGLSAVTVNAIPEAYQNVSAVTATAADVLANKVIVDATGASIAGAMTNNGAVSKTLDATTGNQSYTIPTGYHNGNGAVNIVLETKSATPTKSTQTIIPTTGKVLSSVSVAAIPAAYQDVTNVTATEDTVLSPYVFVDADGTEVTGTIATNDADNLTASGATVTVPAGYYATDATKTISAGALSASATGSATVSSLSVAYNSTSEKFAVTGSGTITGTATASVSTAGYVDTSATGTGSTTGTANVNANLDIIGGVVTVENKKVTPTISNITTGTISGHTQVGNGTVTTDEPSSTYYVAVKSDEATTSLTPQVVVIQSGYGDTTHNGLVAGTATVGANASSVSYVGIDTGSAVTPATTITTNPTISVSASGLITASYSGSQNVSPTQTAGYIPAGSGTAGTITTTGSATQQLTTVAAMTYYPSATDQTIAPARYITGTQTIKAVALANLTAANIKSGTTVKVGDSADDDRVASVAGTFTAASTVSTGQTAAAAGQLLTGYSAWVNGAEVKGNMTNNGAVSKTLDATTSNQSYTVPAGYHNGSGTVSITLEEKSATPSASSQNITPTAGKVLSKVTVNAIPANWGNTTGDDAVAANILAGKKAHSIANGSAVALTGTMANNGAISGIIDGLTTTSYTVPAGYTSGGSVSLDNTIETALAAI